MSKELQRINQYLAHSGIASRREADALIKAGAVLVNGIVAELFTKVDPEKDKVEVVQKGKPKQCEYYVYNKPRGVVTTNPVGKEIDIIHAATFPIKVFPVGRLDKDSTGLILLTNDGRITGRLLDPEFHHEKEYEVTIQEPVTNTFVQRMAKGVRLNDGYMTRPAKVKQVGSHVFTIVLTEGKNRQIRRMTEALRCTVRELKRTRIEHIKLGNLKLGTFRSLTKKELAELFVRLQLPENKK